MREGEIVVDVVDHLLGQCEDDDLAHHFCGQFTTVEQFQAAMRAFCTAVQRKKGMKNHIVLQSACFMVLFSSHSPLSLLFGRPFLNLYRFDIDCFFKRRSNFAKPYTLDCYLKIHVN